MTLFMNNGYFHIKNGYFLFAPQVPLHAMNFETPYCPLPCLIDGARDYVDRIRAIANNDLIPNLITSLHL